MQVHESTSKVFQKPKTLYTFRSCQVTRAIKKVITFTFRMDAFKLDLAGVAGSGSKTGLAFLLLENFLRLRLSAASGPK